jgi:hypothetical protein
MNSIDILPKFIVDYLEKFSSNYWELENDSNKKFENIIVIPSIAESQFILNCLKSLEENDSEIIKNTLVIVVINNSKNSNEEIIKDNYKTFHILREYDGCLNINYIDAFSPDKALPDKLAGVGLARKIGLDLALSKFNYESLNSKILYCLDADCKVEKNYLKSVIFNFHKYKLKSAVIEYEHIIEDNSNESIAIVCYETFLRYLKLALTYSKSHYNYHSIGSTIICDVQSYINSGGMNTKKAGEDFYFLEKLAKQNKVYTIKETLVYPSSRKSWRVPFGTGRRISNFIPFNQREYLAYNFSIFELLKEWLEFFNSEDANDTSEIISKAKKISNELYNFLISQNFKESWNRILKNSTADKELQKQKIFWFDAFRTLKLIHHLRDTIYPNSNIYDSLQILLKKMNANFDCDFNKIKSSYQLQKNLLISLRKFFRDNL